MHKVVHNILEPTTLVNPMGSDAHELEVLWVGTHVSGGAYIIKCSL